MARPPNVQLRPFSPDETAELTRLSKATAARLDHVRRARALLAVAAGQNFTAAARSAGFRSSSTITALITRFNARGLAVSRPGRFGFFRPFDDPRASLTSLPGLKTTLLQRTAMEEIAKTISCRTGRSDRPVWLDGKPVDHLVVLPLRIAHRQPRIDLQRLPAGMPGIWLYQGIVDPLLLEPGQQEMPQLVR